MAEFINTIDILGDDGLHDALVTRTLPAEFNDDVIDRIGYRCFAGQKILKKINVPNLTLFYIYCCMNSTSLDTVIAPKVADINSYSFQGCTALVSLVLSGESMASLGGPSAFKSTPIASGTGYIYVPAALINSYKTATNWSTYAAQFRALEDYTVDGTVTGELDETKI